jgi:hypothetical protein
MNNKTSQEIKEIKERFNNLGKEIQTGLEETNYFLKLIKTKTN